MTGDDVKRQVMEVLLAAPGTVLPDRGQLAAALDPCVVLTAEEAEKVLGHLAPEDWADPSRALLTLDQEDEDVGPPAPGEGGDLDNPEIGMKC